MQENPKVSSHLATNSTADTTQASAFCIERTQQLVDSIVSQDPTLARFYEHLELFGEAKNIVHLLAQCSPFLFGLVQKHPLIFQRFFETGIDEVVQQIHNELDTATLTITDPKHFMVPLRIAKAHMALAIALADITGIWSMETCTAALSDFADKTVQLSLTFLLKQTHSMGMLTLPHPENPMKESGVFVLGMGKLGSQTLNYSSDIDLIILYDPEKLTYSGRHSLQHCMSKIAQDLVTLMQERTKDGYVFRTDLRLRPDPSSTPPAITLGAAISYYETVGQNWERAAMIKARIIAGDDEVGERFLSAIQPFMWRRHLDFAAIDDILSIKRQMHRGKGSDIHAIGHNIKTGYGGIREIEFFGQIYQLIWGGKRPELRLRGTLETLRRLETLDMASGSVVRSLSESYRYLRTVEHRLQMIADQQTQTIPEDPEQLQQLAHFLGYIKPKDFCRELESHLKLVHAHYLAAFKESEPLSSEGSLVFTGVDQDPATLETLTQMGFSHPQRISTSVMDWHKGNRRCTKTHRSRELLTELMPAVLKALSETANPDDAFARFDEFMARLPAGVQIFSLFNSNPELLKLIAEILGSAPALGNALSHDPHLLEAALLGDFYGELPSYTLLKRALNEQLIYARDDEDALMMLHRFRKEKMFQAGVQLLKGMVDAETTGVFLSDLADCLLEVAVANVISAFETQYGYIEGGSLGILALGKLGTREMTFESDIDLVFVYRTAPQASASYDGEKSLMPAVYYNRLSQRILGTFTAQSRHGKLYDVDTRLRPFGNDGALAVTIESLDKYYTESAWVFEKLALTRGRVLFATDNFARDMDMLIRKQQTTAPSATAIAQAIHTMRDKITQQFGSDNPWDIKYAHGGLMDTDFIVQYWILTNAGNVAGIPADTVPETLKKLRESKRVHVGYVSDVMLTRSLLTTLLFYLRLCSNGSLDETTAPEGLKKILVQATGMPDFAALKHRLLESEHNIHDILKELGN